MRMKKKGDLGKFRRKITEVFDLFYESVRGIINNKTTIIAKGTKNEEKVSSFLTSLNDDNKILFYEEMKKLLELLKPEKLKSFYKDFVFNRLGPSSSSEWSDFFIWWLG